MAVYKVSIEVPGTKEEVVTSADSEEEAKELAVASALHRLLDAATVYCVEVPDDPHAA